MKLQFFIMLSWLSIFSVQLFSQAGALDETFNSTGIRLYDFGDLHDNGPSLVTLDDTTTVVLGSGEFSGVTSAYIFKIKQNSDVDTDFGGSNGVTVIQAGAYATYPRDILQLANGKFLVSGTAAPTASDEKFFAARFLSDGSLDTDFGVNGFFISDYGTDLENCHAMVVQSDGMIILAGTTYEGAYSQYLFLRLSSDGVLDPNFGTGGYSMIDESPQGETIFGLGFLSDGTIVGVGEGFRDNPYFNYWSTMVKLLDDGSPVTSFGSNGVLIIPIFNAPGAAREMRIRNDSIFVTGVQETQTGESQIFLTKLDEYGIADPSFGNAGIQLTSPDENPFNQGMNLLLSGNGKIYVCGKSGYNGFAPRDFALIRYLPDGSYDDAFDEDGIVLTDIRPDWDEAYSMGMQPDGKLILTGMSSGTNTSGDHKLPIVRYLNDYTPFGAAFSANFETVCEGGTVDFTDQSTGNIVSWAWTFEGGTPSSSTDEDPTVTYSTIGEYDVQLIVTDDENMVSTILKTDYIHVITSPGQADQPSGPTEICNNEVYEYTTNTVENALTYEWEIVPDDAGTLTVNDTMVTFLPDETWSGDLVIKVKADNICGGGEWSDELEITMFAAPILFNIEGGGGYCLGGDGVEITLSGSETGIDYELYNDGVPTGIIVAGTGSEISFGLITDEGNYAAVASNSTCETITEDDIPVEILFPPLEPATPTGPEVVCLETTSDYVSTGSSGADGYQWEISPEDAGTIESNELEATVTWNNEFTGTVMISLYATNECGAGESSEALEVSVGAPNPQVEGEAMVCDWSDEVYHVADNEGSTYDWVVTGGTILEGQGTYIITVSWEGEGQGSIAISEETADGCEGDSDLFEVVIDDCTGIDESDFENSISLKPNPANEFVWIKSKTQIETVSVFSLSGNKIDSFAPAENMTKLNVSTYESGVYLVMIQTQSGIVSKRLVIK